MDFNCNREDLGYYFFLFFFIVIKVSEALEQIAWGSWATLPLEIFKNSLDQYIPEMILT